MFLFFPLNNATWPISGKKDVKKGRGDHDFVAWRRCCVRYRFQFITQKTHVPTKQPPNYAQRHFLLLIMRNLSGNFGVK